MPQERALKKAIKKLLLGYKEKITGFSANDFLKTGVDPFRFSINVSLYDLKKSIRKEIEHKLEMALENLVGAFHEDYLGNCTNIPSDAKWEKVPEGQISGVDLKNENLRCYLQVKSKHNSMNSSSSTRLAQQLRNLSDSIPGAIVGCAWIIAWQDKKCIGENKIDEVGIVLKGKNTYKYITGNENEMDEVVSDLPTVIEDLCNEFDINFEGLLDTGTDRVLSELENLAYRHDCTVTEYMYKRSVD